MPARNPHLDAIRAVAILLVVLHHLADVLQMPQWLSLFALRGYIGVDLFFVLSGWLIGGQLFRAIDRSGRVDLLRFWSRRWARTLPAYYAVLLLPAAVAALFRVAPQDFGLPVATVSNIFFAQNYTDFWSFPISWSLCIEEQFYLLLPIVLLVVLRWRWLTLPIAVPLLGLSPVLRWLAYDGMMQGSFEDYHASFYAPTHLRLDGLVVGVLFAAAKERRTSTWAWCERHARVLAGAGVLVLLASSYNPWAFAWTETDRMSWFGAVPHFFGVSFGVGMMLPAAVAARVTSPRWWPPVATWIAEHAYALYLVHGIMLTLVLRACIAAGLSNEWAVVALILGGTAAAAWLLRRCIEQPGLALRDRWEVRRASGRVALDIAEHRRKTTCASWNSSDA